MKKIKYVCLLSGGLDSATCLYWAKDQGFEVEALTVDYGQRHKKEIKRAVKIAKRLGCPHHIVKFKFDWRAGALTDKKALIPNRPLAEIARHAIPDTYVPGRNTIFLSFALSLCESINACGVIIGANQIDYSGYPDCRGAFLRKYEQLANLGSSFAESKNKFHVLAPLLNKTKTQIVRLAYKLKVPLDLTWSCYRGLKRPCGTCDSCVLRADAFSAAGLEDPAYRE